LAKFHRKREIGPEMPAFRALDFVSRLPIPQSQDANCRKSPAMSPIIPVLGRLWAETGADRLHCRPSTAHDFALSCTHAVIQLDGADPRP